MNKNTLLLSILFLQGIWGVKGQNNDSLSLKTQELQEVTIKAVGNSFTKKKSSNSLRINQTVNNLPQNIQVLTADLIEGRHITTIDQGVVRNVSGAVRLEEWGDVYARINMRGSRASAFRNGMNISSVYGPLSEDMSFVESIEFVKGPAGFMMSNGEPSGIYNVVTKKPTGQNRQKAGLEFGSYDFVRATADVDGILIPKSNKVWYRLNMAGQYKNGMREFEFNKRFSFAPSMTFLLSDKTTLTTEYTYQYLKMSDFGANYLFSKDGFASLPRKRTFGDPGFEPTVINDQSFLANLQHVFNDHWKLTAQAAYMKFEQEGQYMWVTHIDEKGDFVRTSNLWDAENESVMGQIFVNGDFKTGSLSHNILGGLDIGHKRYLVDWSQKFDYDTIGSFNIYNDQYQVPVNGYPDFDRSQPLAQRVAQYGIGQADVGQSYTGLYLQDEIGLFDDKLLVTIAGRYTTVRENANRDSKEDRKFTPRFGLNYKLFSEMNVYALYDQTFVPQTGIRRDGGEIKPLTGNNMEIGFKNQWFNRKWNSTVSLYRIIKKNHLSGDPLNAPGENYVLQLGETRTQGLELDINGSILPGLSINANYAYTESEVTKETKQAAKGTRLSGFAKHVANAWLNYTFQSGPLENLSFMGGITFMGDRATWAFGGDTSHPLPDYTRVDLGASWKYDEFKVSLLVNNVFDRYLYNGAYYNSRGGFYYWRPEDASNFKLSLTYNF